MNKTELAAAVAETLEVSNNKGLEAVNAVFEAMKKEMGRGRFVFIPDFGKFELLQSKARIGRNPKTGEPLDIPEKTVVKFRPAKSLKEWVDRPMPF